MQSRRDQVQAYFFVVGRLFSALTHGKPDIVDPPTRKFTTGAMLGAILGMVLVAVFGIVGIYLPGKNTAWQQPGAIIVEKETGARFVYLNGRLRPVLNFTSAKLATAGGSAGGSAGTVVTVSENSLSGVPVGAPIGIPGAPDEIPASAALDKGPWTLCVSTSGAGPTVTLLLNNTAGTPLALDQGLLVSISDGSYFLLAGGMRFRIDNSTVLEGLGYSTTPPLMVPASWVNAIPAGRDLTVPAIDGIGDTGPTIDGQASTVGQILEVQNPALHTDQVFVVLANGIAPLTTTTESLLVASPATRAAYGDQTVKPIEVAPTALANVPTVTDANLAGYPSAPPKLANGSLSNDTVPCGRYSTVGTNSSLLLMPAATVAATASPTVAHTAGTTIDQVSIPGGGGVLALSLPAAGASTGTEFLVTDFGEKFPLASADVATDLGYPATSAVDVASQLLALLPTGPVLSRSAALAAAPTAPAASTAGEGIH